MALLLQGRGYNLRRGVHFRDGGTSACCHEGGTVALAVPLACARVPRGVRPDQGPSRPRRGEPPRSGAGCRAWTQRSSTRARPKSRLRPAPPGARRGEPAAALLPVERERARDEEEVAPAEVSVRLRLGASLLPWVTIGSPPSCQSRRGYRSLAPGYMLPLAGRGYDKQGGYIKSHKDGI